MTKTKIICTLGPASSDETVLRKMILAGMDVARLNFSHSKHPELIRKIKIIRLINKKYRRRIRFLGDLEGHRIRIGGLAGGAMELKKGWVVCLTQKDIKGADRCIPFDYRGPLRDIKKGQYIFIDDGNIALEVKGYSANNLTAKVVIGGILKEHKGVNIPDAKLKFGRISRNDVKNILFSKKYGLDYIAQSFVRTSKDMLAVQDVLGNRSKCRLIAKIENRDGVKNIDEIIRASDGIMIARGDMGVSLPIYEVPIIQKMIIRKCNRAGKFVITATQMLESMTENHIPTRAEVSDVANAIIDGTDFVMLSAESAIGRYPVETVRMMNSIIKFTEGYLNKLIRNI
ncbi:MAG: pyruvate kinase [Candidatus Omnitrophica bacterium]|nr:pyruvate kinase [Candidatus Omnitrophota bacterium]MBU4487488.1 pyruvate kinase [Candidatus Omnitrophota bacterium]MCG2704914.1 pyruvate kinase [Candidatus Omnitrophota bacterium]